MKTITFDETKWKLVPVEPTEEIIQAICDAKNLTRRGLGAVMSDAELSSLYRAMLSAAPAGPSQEPIRSLTVPGDLPGMWDHTDLSGGETDAAPSQPAVPQGLPSSHEIEELADLLESTLLKLANREIKIGQFPIEPICKAASILQKLAHSMNAATPAAPPVAAPVPAVPQGELAADEWICEMAKRYAGTVVERHGHTRFLFTLAELLALIATLRGKQANFKPDYSWLTVEDYGKCSGFSVNDAFRIGWNMARTTDTMLGIKSDTPAPSQPVTGAWADGVQSAADLLKRMAVELVTERGETDPDTGAVQFKSAATREWHESLCELAEEIERLKPADPAQPSKYGSPELQALIVAHVTAAPVDERTAFEAEMRGKHGWNGSYFTQSNDGGYLSNRATYAYIGWQARAAMLKKEGK